MLNIAKQNKLYFKIWEGYEKQLFRNTLYIYLEEYRSIHSFRIPNEISLTTFQGISSQLKLL